MERTGLAVPAARGAGLSEAARRFRVTWETQTVSSVALGRLLGVFVLLVIAASAAGLGHGPGEQTFLLVFTSIVIEALPFILLGALASAAIAVFLPERTFASISRLPLALQLPTAALGGVAFPVCECGSVPVARRLISRGVHPAAGITFMLASPVMNPIVLASTWVAYGGHERGAEMVAGRAGLGLVTAVVAGLAIGRTRAADLLRSRDSAHEHEHAQSHGHAGRATAFSGHLVSDFLFMGKFIVLGAALSALVQAVVPESAISGLGGAPILSALALMAVAYLLSLCSEADAFIAASFTSFSLGSQLAFLVLGPIADLKLSMLYGATFRRLFVVRLLLVTVPVILAGSLVFEVLIR
jgi:uncharacterized membrane protein YraQ (UPF0718 family)